MKNNKIFFILLLLLFCLSPSNCLKCKENEIENCLKCETNQNSDKCSLCEDKSFLALNGEVCIKCDDPYNGMIGCSGTCTFDEENLSLLCQENSCKQGYYELIPGYCAICSLSVENCLECEYSKEKNEFKCLKCEDNFFPNAEGICEQCEEEDCKKCLNKNFCIECKEGLIPYPDGLCHVNNIENCKIGIYSEEKNNSVCLECENQYYSDSDGHCKYCSFQSLYVNCIKCHEEEEK